MMKFKISKSVKIGVAIFLPVILLIGVFFYKVNIYDKNIDNILKTDAYSYLSPTVQEYIKNVYMETGDVILTEKNKIENMPYLNPQYIEYLNMSDEKKNEVDLLPEVYIIDYVIDKTKEAVNAPTKYDLRNLNGKNYISALKDQKNLGLCWSFATIENAETYLMLHNDQPYVKGTSQEFSIRQMDYASSTDGIFNYKNEYGYRSLTSGGNYYMSSLIAASGLTFVDDEYMPYNENKTKKNLVDILSYENANYAGDSFIHLPKLSLSSTQSEINSYVNVIKKYVMEYGGPYVGTYSPQGTCGTKNSDGSYFIEVDDCYKNINSGSHAMQLIGWDDDYEYSYCKYSNTHSNVLDDGTCSKGILKNGKGAWIIRNSWGDIPNYKYVYLTYNSVYTDFGFITSMENMNERNWDNVYSDNLWEANGGYSRTSDEQVYYKKGVSNEKIEKIKFYSEGVNGSYSVSIMTDSGNYNKVKTINTEYPGIVTIDLEDKNIIIKDDSFTVKIDSNNNTNLITDTIFVFTSNVISEPEVNLSEYDGITIFERNNNFYSETKNIPYKASIEYKLYDINGNDKSSYITYGNNLVARNNVNTTISFDSGLRGGKYRLKAFYDSSLVGSVDFFYTKMEGLGTEDNPYIITNPEQLYQIRDDLDGYYELGNDIDLTEATREGGIFFNENPDGPGGHGWASIDRFSGTLDGNGYAIKGLYQNNYITWTDENNRGYSRWRNNSNGLFSNIVGNVTIKNLVLDDFDINCQGSYCGILASKYYGSMTEYGSYDYSDKTEYTATFENIIVKNSKVSGVYNGYNSDSALNSSYGGGLFGFVDNMNGSVNISNIYLDFDASQEEFTGASYLSYGIYGKEININNIQLLGNFTSEFSKDHMHYQNSYVFAQYINSYSSNDLNINNVLSTVYGRNTKSFFTLLSNMESFDIKNLNIINVDDINLFNSKIIDNSSNINIFDRDTQISELVKKSNYSTWNNFDDHWVMKTIDGIPRMPVLKFVDFEYTKINDINYSQELNKKKSIYDYITPDTSAAKRILYKSNNQSIVDIDKDGIIIPKKSGKTTIHIESLYDGYIKNVPITVNYKPHYVVHFDSNGGTGNMDSLEVSTSENCTLPVNLFEKDNYEFNGWNTKADGSGTSYNDLDEMEKLQDKEEITLYAQWIGLELTITFDPNGGEVNPTSKTVRYGDELGDLPLPKKEGYAFSGWTNKSIIFDMYDEVYSNYTLVANWNSDYYDIILHSNGGSNDSSYFGDYMPLSNGLFYDAARNNFDKKLPGNLFIKDGYNFVEWNTKEDGSGISYLPEQIINLNNVPDSLLELYAQWEIEIRNINNSSTDYDGIYDGNSHTIDLNVDVDDYNILYSKDGVNYNIDTIPKYKEVGEYKIYYKITKDGYEDLYGSNYVRIYGIKKIDDSIIVKDNNLILKNNDFINLTSKFNFYANSAQCYHISNNVKETDIVKTGDILRIDINNTKNFDYNLVYLGDVNGDGEIGIIDYIRIMKDIMGTTKLSGVYYEAADMNENGSVDIIDYIRIMKIIMEEN